MSSDGFEIDTMTTETSISINEVAHHPTAFMTLSAVKRECLLTTTSFKLIDGCVIFGSISSPPVVQTCASSNSRPGLLFIHGLGSNRKVWEEMAMHFVSLGFKFNLVHHNFLFIYLSVYPLSFTYIYNFLFLTFVLSLSFWLC